MEQATQMADYFRASDIHWVGFGIYLYIKEVNKSRNFI